MHKVIAATLLLTSCTVQHRQPPPAPPIAQAAPIQEPAPVAVVPPSDAEFLDPTSPEVAEAFDRYLKSGKAPLISKKASGFVQFPYGLSQPVVYCRPLELCDIELAPGEEVLDFAAGDKERWVFQPLREGPADKRIVHIMVKPTDLTSDMQTTIVIGTNQRTYRIRLISRLHGAIVNARFYYPEDMIKQLNSGEKRLAPVPVLDMAAILATQEQYTVEGDESLRPTIVGNNGTQTVCIMPSSYRTQDAGVAYELSPRGTRTLVNSRLVNGIYTIDKLVKQAVLVWGVGADERVVTIFRNRG